MLINKIYINIVLIVNEVVEIEKKDVDRAEKGHGNSLLKIAKAVLFNNRERYQKKVS